MKLRKMRGSAKAAIIALAMATSILSSSCGKVQAIDCPFTDLGWDATVEDLSAANGESNETYKSTYGGKTYTYPDSYMGCDGTVKYMYDDKEKLMCVAFAYGSDDAEELKDLYEKIAADVEDEHGPSSYGTDASTNYGKVWELKGGHIILSVMLTNSSKALQVAYQNPAAN